MRMRINHIAFVLVLCSFGVGRFALACSYITPAPTPVADHFRVVVQDRGRPVVGLEVSVRRWQELSKQWEQVMKSLTDAAGTVEFAGVADGSYNVGTNAIFKNDSVDVEVLTDPSKKKEEVLNLRWPGKVIVANGLNGSLASLAFDKDEVSRPIDGAGVELYEAYSGQLLQTVTTDQDGSFKFSVLTPGLYFLHVSHEFRQNYRDWLGNKSLDGIIAVEYHPIDLGAAEMQLRVRMSNCVGFMYKAGVLRN